MDEKISKIFEYALLLIFLFTVVIIINADIKNSISDEQIGIINTFEQNLNEKERK